MALANGTKLGPYEVTGILGAGGMGEVYRATDTRLGRLVAIKVLPETVATDDSLRQRFEREARTISRLNHPNICTLHDIGEFDGRPFIVMEVVEGDTLQQLLEKGPLDPSRLLDLSIQLADGLDAAHQEGVIHRDIKPANIVATDRGHAKLLDFGLAKLAPHTDVRTGTDEHHVAATIDDPQLTQPRMAVGTIAYMSPEQARGEELDPRTDVFSLGAVIYEMATGRRAFPGQTTAVIFDAILNRPPTHPVHFAPDIPARLGEVISNAVEKQRSLRYQNASDLRADLMRTRRDLDSGQSVSLSTASTAGAIYTSGTATTVASSTAQSAPPSANLHVADSQPVTPSHSDRRPWLYGTFAVMLVVILGMMFFRTTRSGVTPAQPRSAANVTESIAPAEPVAPPAAAPTPAAVLPPPVAAPAASPPASEAVPEPAPVAPSPVPSTPAPPPQAAPPPVATIPPPVEPVAEPVPMPEAITPAPAAEVEPAPADPPAAEVAEPAAAPEPDTPVPPSAPTPAEDEATIRGVLATFERAIETQDISLYRSVRPSLSASEERRLRDAFDAVESQAVTLDIRSIEIAGNEATVEIARVDTLRINGREQTQESMQTMTFQRQGDGWVIVESS